MKSKWCYCDELKKGQQCNICHNKSEEKAKEGYDPEDDDEL